MRAMSLIGVGLLLGWLIHPLGYLLVAYAAWRLRDRTAGSSWLVAASLAAAVGQTATWHTHQAPPWSFGGVAGVLTDILVCSVAIHLVQSHTVRAWLRVLRVALPVSYCALAWAWAPTQGDLMSDGAWSAALITALALQLALGLTLVALLLGRPALEQAPADLRLPTAA